MKNELKFEASNELKVLNAVFHMFKYGVDDEDKKLMILSSTLFKDIFNSIRKNYLTSMQETLEKDQSINEVEYIEDNPVQFEIMKKYVEECKKGIDYFDDFSWDKLGEDKKAEYVKNLASPFSIKEETVSILV